jgi:hypothetical protein
MKGACMRRKVCVQKIVICILVCSLIMPYGVVAQNGSPSSSLFSKEQLAQMLAPIALYPDSLLAQILMASTYPLEIVQADRWVKENRSLKGDALDKQLLDKTWDVSVKSLCHFPDVLAEMSKNLDRTAKLGDAFLAQQKEVMDTVQELRRKAQQAGNLKSTKEQTVVVEKETIVIQPATSSVVYVPAYNPTVVYGSWWYPSYPPYSYAYPWYPGAGAFAFGAGFAVGAAVASWSNCNWNNGSISVNHNVTNNFNRSTNVSNTRQNWQHNPQHRQGVAYRDSSTSQRFGQSSGSSMQGRGDSRGYGNRAAQQPRDSRQQGISDRGGMDRGGSRDAFQQRGGGASQRDSAFGGYGSGSSERMSSDRGRSSRESFQRSSGGFSGGSRSGGFSGGSRGGGGGRGGGRR